ncbi:hypothetical protein [Oscillatoria sp. FACHB-1406]|nr:hypothetical protein [Oscillatoria sp. FACHB-1406]
MDSDRIQLYRIESGWRERSPSQGIAPIQERGLVRGETNFASARIVIAPH